MSCVTEKRKLVTNVGSVIKAKVFWVIDSLDNDLRN